MTADTWYPRLELLRERLSAELDDDTTMPVLDGLRIHARGEPLRVIVCGETKRGKSTLVNSMIGRPLLSPVGVDVTTACWLELRYGEREEAHAVLADPDSLAAPRRVPIDLREVERYVALQEVTDPVLGVEVRVRAPLLRDLVLVDTPGVGGLRAGHSRTTLAALRHADVLLFVCDATQPILAPEVTFLREAAARVPAVLVAATKCDVNPGFADVLDETRARLAAEPALRATPLFPVAATLLHRAADVENEVVAARLTELSGIGPLVESILRQAATGDAVRVAGIARVLGAVARTLAARTAHAADVLDGDTDREPALRRRIAALDDLLADHGRRTAEVHRHFARLRAEPLDEFAAEVTALASKYRTEAERGPAAQLTTLAPRMLADLTATGIATLEAASADTAAVLRRLLTTLELTDTAPSSDRTDLDLGLQLPDPSPTKGFTAGLTHTADVFGALTKMVAGAATVISVLTGPGVVAACLALAAGAGWWQVRGDDERQRRAHLGSWVDSAAKDARSRLEAELRRRLRDAERYVDTVVPEIAEAKRHELRRLRDELTDLREAGTQARNTAAAARRAMLDRLDRLAAEADTLAAEATDRK